MTSGLLPRPFVAAGAVTMWRDIGTVLIGVQKDPRSGVIGVEQGPLILMV